MGVIGQKPKIISHFRDILLLPGTVAILIPGVLLYFNELFYLFDILWVKLIGGIIMILGISLFSFSVYLFHQMGRGTLAPWNAPDKLVVDGPYRYSRNPMIFSVWIVLCGEALLFASGNIMVWAMIFFIINHFYFIWREEPDLERKFGKSYINYKQQVPRWFSGLKY